MIPLMMCAVKEQICGCSAPRARAESIRYNGFIFPPDVQCRFAMTLPKHNELTQLSVCVVCGSATCRRLDEYHQ